MKKIFFTLLLLFILVGCSFNKELNVIDYNKFNNVLINNAFYVDNNSDSYTNSSYIKEAYVARQNDEFMVEFIVYDNDKSAKTVINNHINSFKMLKSTGATEINENGKNYQKYILISNNYYMSSIRVDNTLIFCKTSLKNKDVIEKIYKELNY